MNERLIVYLAEIILATAAIGGIAIIFAASWYDMRAVARKARLRAIASELSELNKPSIVMLIYAHNDATAIEACLESIATNTYSNYKIVVVNNASTDMTTQIIAGYKKAHSGVVINIHTLKRFTDRVSALRASYEKIHKSDLVFILDATDRLSDTAIQNAATRFVAQPQLDAIRIRRHLKSDVTIRTLPGHFAALTKNMVHKALSGRVVMRKTLEDNGTVVRNSIFSPDTRIMKMITAYESTATFTSTHPSSSLIIPTRQRKITLGLIVVLLACIALMTYFFYTAATLRSNILLTLSWVLVSLWLFAVVWSDEIMNLSKKLTLTSTIPFMYFLLYFQLYVGVYQMFRQLRASMSTPRLSIKRIHDVILQEAYSTRF